MGGGPGPGVRLLRLVCRAPVFAWRFVITGPVYFMLGALTYGLVIHLAQSIGYSIDRRNARALAEYKQELGLTPRKPKPVVIDHADPGVPGGRAVLELPDDGQQDLRHSDSL